MKDKVKESMRFYILATKLKYKIRSGWSDDYWDIKGRRESVAEHVYGTCILAISLYSNMNIDIDFDKVLKMLVLHEIGEVIIGDITPYDGVSIDEKMNIEHDAMRKVIGSLEDKNELYELLLEFDLHETKESKFAYMCDKMDADIQAKIYQDKNLAHELSDNLDNIIFNSDSFKNAVLNGDKTMFDVWCRNDEQKYDELFLEVLNYIKEINTDMI